MAESFGKAMNDWDIVCPDKLKAVFPLPAHTDAVLNLKRNRLINLE